MKKFLLFNISFYALISSLAAQNWRPFNPNDTVRHYLAEDSISRHTTFYPILSIVIDTNYSQNNHNVSVLKKGFSYVKAFDLFFNASNDYQKIKGKILGDTVFLYHDSTIITSIDSNGFRLNFPCTYSRGQSWQIAKSNSQSIYATVDSVYFDSIPKLMVDSLISIRLQLLDSMGIAINNSTFNQKIILSKHNGLIRTIDFTDLDKTFAYNHYNWESKNRIYLKHEEHISLTTGDYYYALIEDSTFRYRTVKYTVVSDITSSQLRNVEIERQHSKNFIISTWPPTIPHTFPDSFQVNSIDTVHYSLKLDSNYRIKQSGIIEDSDRPNFFYNQYNRLQYGLESKNGDLFFVDYKDADIEISSIGFYFPFPDSIRLDYFESSSIQFPIYGIGSQHRNYANFMGVYYNSYEGIFFIRKGNFVWGNEPILVSNKNHLKVNNDVSLFPNPVKDILNFTNATQIKHLKLFDQNGRLVLEEKSPQSELRLTNLPSALYFIQIEMQSGELINHKLIKQ